MAFGLTDDQARTRSTVSALSIGGLIKHVTAMQRTWMQRVAAAPGEPPPEPRPFAERVAEYESDYVMAPDEPLAAILGAFTGQNAATMRLAQTANLDAAVPVPRDSPWFPKDVDAWSVRRGSCPVRVRRAALRRVAAPPASGRSGGEASPAAWSPTRR